MLSCFNKMSFGSRYMSNAILPCCSSVWCGVSYKCRWSGPVRMKYVRLHWVVSYSARSRTQSVDVWTDWRCRKMCGGWTFLCPCLNRVQLSCNGSPLVPITPPLDPSPWYTTSRPFYSSIASLFCWLDYLFKLAQLNGTVCKLILSLLLLLVSSSSSDIPLAEQGTTTGFASLYEIVFRRLFLLFCTSYTFFKGLPSSILSLSLSSCDPRDGAMSRCRSYLPKRNYIRGLSVVSVCKIVSIERNRGSRGKIAENDNDDGVDVVPRWGGGQRKTFNLLQSAACNRGEDDHLSLLSILLTSCSQIPSEFGFVDLYLLQLQFRVGHCYTLLYSDFRQNSLRLWYKFR